LARIDQAASLANQVRHDPLDVEVVDRYTAALTRGAKFPPILVTPHGDSYAILSGNHRHAAHENANHSTQPAYIVTAPAPVLLRIRVEDNANHGLPLTLAERIEHAIALMATGMPQSEAAAVVAVPQPKLSIAAAVHHADRRADDLDVAAGWARLPQATRYQLSQLDDDTVFAETSNLVVAAALPLAHVKRLVRALVAVDPIEALRLVGQEAEDWNDRTADQDGRVRANRTARATLDRALAEIRGLDPAAVAAACPTLDVAAVLAQRILDTAAVLAACHEQLTTPQKRQAS
jgi:hypothetical protein